MKYILVILSILRLISSANAACDFDSRFYGDRPEAYDSLFERSQKLEHRLDRIQREQSEENQRLEQEIIESEE